MMWWYLTKFRKKQSIMRLMCIHSKNEKKSITCTYIYIYQLIYICCANSSQVYICRSKLITYDHIPEYTRTITRCPCCCARNGYLLLMCFTNNALNPNILMLVIYINSVVLLPPPQRKQINNQININLLVY